MCLVGQDAEDNELQESSEIHEIPVVREEWVIYSVQCKKHLPLGCFQAPVGDDHAGQVFGHLNICLGGITMKDKQSVWALIMSKGGNVNFELNKHTTHLVVGAASGPKYFEALKRNSQNAAKLCSKSPFKKQFPSRKKSLTCPTMSTWSR